MKGVSEDLPAILIVMIMIVVFLLAMTYAYSNYFGSASEIEKKRIASSIAEDISLNRKILVDTDPASKGLQQPELDDYKKSGVIVKIYNQTDGDLLWKSSDEEFKLFSAVSSAAVLVYSTEEMAENLRYTPARADVYVGE